MVGAFVASAVSGIGLHLAGHESSHEAWHLWAVAHIAASCLMLMTVGQHTWKHHRWYASLLRKGVNRKKRPILILSVIFLIVLLSGIALLAFIDGANSPVGLWHYKFGLLLTVFCILHMRRRL